MKKYEILDANEKIEYSNVFGLLNDCFGTNYKGWMKACWKPNDNFYVWTPHLAEEKEGKLIAATSGCLNTLSNDWNTLIFDDLKIDKYKGTNPFYAENRWDFPCLIFAKNPKGGGYIFRGVYLFDKDESSYLHDVFKRIGTRIKTIGDTVYDIEILDDFRKNPQNVIDEDDYIRTTNRLVSKKQLSMK